MHTSKGTVESIDRDHRGKTVTIRVSHGKRQRQKGGPESDVGKLDGYNRPTSNVTLPAKHAKHYTVGQKVECGLGACNDEGAAMPAKTPGPKKAGKKAGKKVPASKKHGAIYAALTKRK